MACGASTAGGYKFLGEPADKFKCLICSEVSIEPQQHKSCGGFFCKECLEKRGKGKACPNCKQEKAVFISSKRCRKSVHALHVKCTNSYKGACCDWKGTGALLEAHMAECKFALVPCPNKCRDGGAGVHKFARKALDQHMKKDCPRREVNCRHCGTAGSYDYTTRAHVEVCPALSINCPNLGCTHKLKHYDVISHLETCEHALLPCKYKNIGCKCMVKRTDITKHEEEADKAHMHLALDVIASLQDSNSGLEYHNEILERTVARLSSSLQDAGRTVAEFVARNCIEMEKLLDTDASATALAVNLNRKVMSLLRVYLSTFTFKITNCQMIKEGTGYYTSEPFYSGGSSGYRIGVKVGLNGRFITVSVNSLVGEFDHELDWPYSGTIAVTLLNQLEDRRHHNYISCIAPENVLMKPGSQLADMRDFFLQSQCNHPGEGTQYLMDDTLYFRILMREARPWLTCSD